MRLVYVKIFILFCDLANAILVLGHERLYSDLSKRFRDVEGVSVVKLAKSGGVSVPSTHSTPPL